MCPPAARCTPDQSLPESQREYREGEAPAERRKGASSRLFAAKHKLRTPKQAPNEVLRQTTKPSGTEILIPVSTVDNPEDWTSHDIVASGDLSSHWLDGSRTAPDGGVSLD